MCGSGCGDFDVFVSSVECSLVEARVCRSMVILSSQKVVESICSIDLFK